MRLLWAGMKSHRVPLHQSQRRLWRVMLLAGRRTPCKRIGRLPRPPKNRFLSKVSQSDVAHCHSCLLRTTTSRPRSSKVLFTVRNNRMQRHHPLQAMLLLEEQAGTVHSDRVTYRRRHQLQTMLCRKQEAGMAEDSHPLVQGHYQSIKTTATRRKAIYLVVNPNGDLRDTNPCSTSGGRPLRRHNHTCAVRSTLP